MEVVDSGGRPIITTEEVGCLVGDYPHDPHPEVDAGVLEEGEDGEEVPGEGTVVVIEC